MFQYRLLVHGEPRGVIGDWAATRDHRRWLLSRDDGLEEDEVIIQSREISEWENLTHNLPSYVEALMEVSDEDLRAALEMLGPEKRARLRAHLEGRWDEHARVHDV